MLEEVIRRVALFSTLPPRHLRWLAENAEAQDILAGTLLYREGDPADTCYILIQGEIELFERLPDGGERIVAVRGPGEAVDELSLLRADRRCPTSARAREDGEVLRVTRASFDALLHRYPQLGYQMARVVDEQLGARIRDLEERLASASSGQTPAPHHPAG